MAKKNIYFLDFIKMCIKIGLPHWLRKYIFNYVTTHCTNVKFLSSLNNLEKIHDLKNLIKIKFVKKLLVSLA